MRDTIFAPATAPGRAAVAVLRLSGPETATAVRALAGALPRPRRASLRRLRSAEGVTLDEALVLWFPGPESFTGEDTAELQVHGGPAVVGAVSEVLRAAGLRLAEPGEFTRRAFEAGRLDLDQAEAVADLVDAETEAQARQAVAQLAGALGRRYESWREALVEALAHLEAAVDFPDEELPADVAARAAPAVRRLGSELAAALADAARGQRVRDGYRIAIIGAPNAGKSSLLNALAGRDAAIVAAAPGTTRDVIEVPLVLAGYKVLLADTAGLRETEDEIEREGVRRALAWAERAALTLRVVDRSSVRPADLGPAGARELLVLAKSDLAPAAGFTAEGFEVSTVTGMGMEALRGALEARVVADLAGGDFPAVTRVRHGELLAEALQHIGRASANLEEPELAAEDVRLAARALARIAGRVGSEDVLDRVFASFCIGK